jgi:hypothetical protein
MYMKRYGIAAFFVFVLLMLLGLTNAADAVSLRIDPPATMLPANGETFSVDVVLDNVTDLGSFEFDIFYPPAVVNITGACSSSATACWSDADCPATETCGYSSAVVLGACLGSTGRTPVLIPPAVSNGTGLRLDLVWVPVLDLVLHLFHLFHDRLLQSFLYDLD